jgi:class 3 adenylate cyclase
MACATRVALAIPVGDVRKVVTVLFSDVFGSTELGEQLDAESIREIMTRYFGQARQILERHGGTVEKFIGDAIMAVFGIPRVHDDDALRAVRAALEIRQLIEALDAEIRERWGLGLRVRTGLFTGEVVAGDPTTDQTFVVGDTVNTAARLEQAAPPGEILIGDPTRELVEHAVELEAVEPLRLKGKTDPVPAFLIRGTLAVDDDAASTRPGDPRVRGRGLELQRLEESFAEVVRQRSAGVAEVVGEAGIGKTALIRAFVGSLGDEAFSARVQVLPTHEAGAETDPLRVLVRRLLEPEGGSTFEHLRASVARSFSGSERTDVLAVGLAHVLGIDAPEGSSATPDEARWAAGEYIRARAAVLPGVLWFDDVHRADPLQATVIEWLPHVLSDAPVLVVRSRRAEPEDPAEPEGSMAKDPGLRISLGPLQEQDAADVLADVLAARPERSLADVLVAAAGGNPLFLRESAKFLLEEGMVRRDHGRAFATRDLASLTVPMTVRAVLEARLDQLSPEERTIVDSASVAADAIAVEALAAMVPSHLSGGAAGLIEALVAKDVVRSESGFVRLRHGLLREVALDGLTKRRCADLHEAYGRWLADREDEIPDPEPVGYHFEQAFVLRRQLAVRSARDAVIAKDAAGWLVRAGNERVRSTELLGAAHLLARALSLLSEGKVEPGDVTRDTGFLAVMLGMWEDAVTMLSPLADRQDDHEVQRALGVALTKRSRDEPGGEEYRRGQAILEELATVGDADATASLAGSWRGIDETKAREWYGRAVERDPTEPYALGNLVEYELSDGSGKLSDESLARVQGAVIRRREQAAAGRDIPWAYFDLGKFGLFRGDAEEALSAYAKAVQLSTADFMLETSDRSLARLERVLPDPSSVTAARRLLSLGLAARFPASAARERLTRFVDRAVRLTEPVLVLVGDSSGAAHDDILTPVVAALLVAKGTVIVDESSPEAVGIVEELERRSAGRSEVIRYSRDRSSKIDDERPSLEERRPPDGEDAPDPWGPLRYWTDLLAGGTDPARVRLLGIGGDANAAFQYRIALALGAQVGIVIGGGPEANSFLRDPTWAASRRLDEVDAGEESIRQFVTAGTVEIRPGDAR